jgi:hypothetical protein
MKNKLILGLLFIAFAINAFASDKTEIADKVAEYFEYVENKQNSELVDMIYPALFEMFPKEMMLSQIENMYADTNVAIRLYESKLEEIEDIFEADGIDFTVIQYSFYMDLKFINELDNEVVDITKNSFYNMYGEENVEWIDNENKFKIYSFKEMFAINDPKYDGWKFLERSEGFNMFYENIFPESAYKKYVNEEPEN